MTVQESGLTHAHCTFSLHYVLNAINFRNDCIKLVNLFRFSIAEKNPLKNRSEAHIFT